MVEDTIIGETATNKMLQTPINVSYQTYLYIDNARKTYRWKEQYFQIRNVSFWNFFNFVNEPFIVSYFCYVGLNGFCLHS